MLLELNLFVMQTNDISTRSLASLQHFAEAVLPPSRLLVRHIICRRVRPLRGCGDRDAFKAMLSSAIVVNHCPNAIHLSLGPGDWGACLPHRILDQLERLEVRQISLDECELEDDHTQNLVESSLNLRELHCDAWDADGYAELCEATTKLNLLQHICLADVATPPEDSLDHYLPLPSFRGPLTSFATDLSLGAAVLQHLAESVGATLESLSISGLPCFPPDAPPLTLPLLHSLKLSHIITRDYDDIDLRVFDNSPLRTVKLGWVVCRSVAISAVVNFVGQHEATLAELVVL